MTSELQSRLESLAAIPGLESRHFEPLRRYVAESPEEALFRLNPVDYAAAAGISEREAIDLFVAATHVGIFEFSWDSLCVNCGAILTAGQTLSQLSSQAHCAMCDVPVEVVLDDAIEVAFTISPRVRAIRFHQPERLSDTADLMRLHFSQAWDPDPDFRAQVVAATLAQALHPGDSAKDHEITVRPGIYRFVDVKHHEFVTFEVAQPATSQLQEVTLELRRGLLTANRRALQAGPLRLHVENLDHAATYWVVVRSLRHDMTREPMERPSRPIMRPFLTGKRLLSNQMFRNLFRAVTVQPGSRFEIRSLTFLFTDLKGSTELYDQIGDLQAYDLVQEHFRILSEVVVQYEGAIVKTMGDAIMATFVSPTDAVRAAQEMHERLAAWNRQNDSDELYLKVGLHTGGCIVVNSHDRLDYFGQTVNIAARIQGLAGSQQTYLSETVHAASGVQAVLSDAKWELTRKVAHLKGVSEDVGVYLAIAP